MEQTLGRVRQRGRKSNEQNSVDLGDQQELSGDPQNTKDSKDRKCKSSSSPRPRSRSSSLGAFFVFIAIFASFIALIILSSMFPSHLKTTVRVLLNKVKFGQLSVTSQKRPPVVVVAGAGLAGLVASHQAVAAGAHVILLEKHSVVGGNSVKATSGINAVLTQTQKSSDMGANDSIDRFTSDILKSGKGLSNVCLARALASRSKSSIAFLDSLGVKFSSVELLGGSSCPRTHRVAGVTALGAAIINAVKTELQKYPSSQFTVSGCLAN